MVVVLSCSWIRRGIDGCGDSGGTPRTSLNDLLLPLPLVVESYCCCCCLSLDRKSVDGDMVFFYVVWVQWLFANIPQCFILGIANKNNYNKNLLQ